jgi:hypothetical protein
MLTPKEQRYLFMATYFTLQGLFLMSIMTYAFYKGRKTNEDKFWGIFAGSTFLKSLNSIGVIINWSNFLDPEGA